MDPSICRNRAQAGISAALPSGRVPTTLVRRRISRFNRSITLLPRKFVQCGSGKSKCAKFVALYPSIGGDCFVWPSRAYDCVEGRSRAVFPSAAMRRRLCAMVCGDGSARGIRHKMALRQWLGQSRPRRELGQSHKNAAAQGSRTARAMRPFSS